MGEPPESTIRSSARLTSYARLPDSCASVCCKISRASGHRARNPSGVYQLTVLQKTENHKKKGKADRGPASTSIPIFWHHSSSSSRCGPQCCLSAVTFPGVRAAVRFQLERCHFAMGMGFCPKKIWVVTFQRPTIELCLERLIMGSKDCGGGGVGSIFFPGETPVSPPHSYRTTV